MGGWLLSARTAGMLLCVIAGSALVWIVVLNVVSRMSGWAKLARRFQQQSAPASGALKAGPWLDSIYLRGWCHYDSVVTMQRDDRGVYLSILFPFRPGHPALFIPWQEIQLRSVLRWFGKFVELQLGNEERVSLRIHMRMADELGIALDQDVQAGSSRRP